MKKVKITKEVKFLDSIGKWCVGIWCEEYGYWTGGFFHKKLEKAEKNAMECLKNGIDFKRELAKKTEKQDLVLEY